MSLPKSRRDLPVLLVHNMDVGWTADERAEAEQEVATLAAAMQDVGHPVDMLAIRDANLASRLEGHDPDARIVFNWCESLPGVPRSEPDVAAVFEDFGFVYTGSPPDVLSLGYDKPRVKRLLDEARIPTPAWRVYDAAAAEDWCVFPAIVKLAHEHCSVGIAPESVVTTPAELRDRIAYVLEKHRQPALVEEFIDGREFHVAVWGNGRLAVLPPAEMDYGTLSDIHDRLFTYDAKYVQESRLYDKIELLVPAELDATETAAMQQVVLNTYRAFGCRDYGRIDVRLRDGVFYVLDVNPNPDINPRTSMTYAAAEAGYSYGEMGSRFVNLAAARHPVFKAKKARAGVRA